MVRHHHLPPYLARTSHTPPRKQTRPARRCRGARRGGLLASRTGGAACRDVSAPFVRARPSCGRPWRSRARGGKPGTFKPPLRVSALLRVSSAGAPHNETLVAGYAVAGAVAAYARGGASFSSPMGSRPIIQRAASSRPAESQQQQQPLLDPGAPRSDGSSDAPAPPPPPRKTSDGKITMPTLPLPTVISESARPHRGRLAPGGLASRAADGDLEESSTKSDGGAADAR